MFKPELIRNKLYALLLIACTLPVMFLEGDATATVFIAMIAVPMFFAKENWILGGYHESQKSRRQDIRRRDVRCREKKRWIWRSSASSPSTTGNTLSKSTP